MAEITFTPEAVSKTANRVVLTDENGSRLTLKLPSRACAQIVYAALLHNLKRPEQ